VATAKAAQTLNALTTYKTRALKAEKAIGNYETGREEGRRPKWPKEIYAHINQNIIYLGIKKTFSINEWKEIEKIRNTA